MVHVLYVVRADGVPERHAAADLLAEGGSVRVAVDTQVGLREDGPFEPLATAIEHSGPLRDELAREIAIPSLRGYGRIRLALLAAAVVPMAMLLELDRELVTAQHTTVGRVVIDLILVAFVVFELSRRTPRLPGVSAIALAAIGLRWALVAARLCAHEVHPLVYAAAALAFSAAVVLAGRVPSSSRVARELLGKMGVTRSAHFAAKHGDDPPGALVAASVACAAGLPAVLHLTRMFDVGLLGQAAVFVGFAAIAPVIARRATEPGTPEKTARPVPPIRILLGAAAGLALTAGLLTAASLFFDTGVEIAQCVKRLDAEANVVRAAKASELARAIAKVRASAPLVIMTTAIFPFAEERIYRGLLQDVLTRKYGPSYAVFAASLAFGVAHLGVYQVALYQTVLLGIGFGVAYLEGGLVAAFFVHAIWNLLQLGG